MVEMAPAALKMLGPCFLPVRPVLNLKGLGVVVELTEVEIIENGVVEVVKWMAGGGGGAGVTGLGGGL